MAESRPTIADVARHAGVSKGLVSFALNNRPGVAPETRTRILESAAALGWTPSVRGRSLSTGRSFACGLVIGRSTDVIAADPFFHSFIAGLEDVFASEGQVLVLAVVTPGRQEADTYRGLAGDKRVDGVVLTDLRVHDDRIGLVTELGLVAVTLGTPDLPSPFPTVSVDDAGGIRAAVRHLIDLGHRNIAHVAGPDAMLHARKRSDAFVEETAEAGVHGQVLITDFSAGQGAEATRALLVGPDRPTAIVYSNDHMAVAGLGVAQRLGLSVPDDLSITGFDDTDLGRHLHPALTTVSTDARAWGAISARILLDAVAGVATGDVELPQPRLTVRESTGSVTARTRGPGRT